jgi:hypothetical protein
MSEGHNILEPMKRLKFKEVKASAEGHIAGEKQNWAS